MCQTSITPLVVYAPAKINLHLEVLGIREDGFHELAMVMQSIDLFDVLSFKLRNDGLIKLETNNPKLSCGDDNLIIRAARKLKSLSNNKSYGVEIVLNKKIPIGAGLAGGSTDAAATLIGLNSLWNLGYKNKDLETISSEFGSDIPFCVSGGTQLCFGRGEILEPTLISNSSLAIILVKDPNVGVSTPWAYSLNKKKNESNFLSTEEEFEQQRNKLRNSEWLGKPNHLIIPSLQNDLEKVVAPLTPSVEKALKLLNEIPGNLGCMMSGSGPSCFALFQDLDSAQKAFESNISKLRFIGLEAWCCSLIGHGVNFYND